MVKKAEKLNVLDKFFLGILLVIFGGIVVHAPFVIGAITLFPAADPIIKSWKEILMVVAAILLLVILMRKKQLGTLRQPIILLIAAYIVLHLLLVPLFWQGTIASISGLLIDLRYVAFFLLVSIAVFLYPAMRRSMLVVFVVGALAVVVFAILQVFVLPRDVLAYIGYGKDTIMSYLFVDENQDFVRINSTLRGPNPLGAYAGIILSLLLAFGLRGNHSQFKKPIPIVAILGIGGIVALWASYSRSALVGALVAIAIILVVVFMKRLPRWAWIISIVLVLAVGGGLFAARNTDFVSNVVLHNNVETGANVDSNAGHFSSLEDGVDRMVHQPFGGGIGSTGSASLNSDKPLIIENQYLFIAHEVGWLGLGLFLYIFWKILRTAWQRRADWLALGVFASGIGLALIGLLLPVWVDDTVSIIWWGLAAVVIGGAYDRSINKAPKRTT